MTTTQKIIKYCALAFALCLIAGIFGAILQGARFIGESLFGESAKMDKYVYLIEEADPVKYESKKLSIEANATKNAAFTNVYSTVGGITIEANKLLFGDDLENHEFEFELTDIRTIYQRKK